ncbi:MAG: HAMP domain-containing protein [Alphaproteobacteria bacterium]|nr:HAMP domain-containing protein [Alphaproteobacteria bacterium]
MRFAFVKARLGVMRQRRFRLPVLRLRAKILAISASTLLSMAAVGAIYFYQTSRIELASQKERGINGSFSEVSGAAQLAHSLDGAVRALVIAPTPERAELANELARQVGELATTYSGAGSVKIVLKNLPELSAEVVRSIETIGYDSKTGLFADINAPISAIDAVLTAEQDGSDAVGKAIETVLRTRQTEKDFMLTQDLFLIGKFKKNIEALEANTTGLPIGSELKSGINDDIKAYAIGFSTYATEIGKVNNALGGLSKRVESLDTMVGTTMRTLKEQLLEAQASLAEEQSRLTTGLAVAIGLAGAIAVILAEGIGRSISKPVVRLQATMRALADGKLDTEITGSGRADEIGEMARTVEVFRDNAIMVRDMTDEAAAQQQRTQAERAEMMRELQRAFGDVVDAANEGNFSRKVEAHFPDDELNALARSVNNLVSTVEKGIGETGAVLSSLADLDLSVRVRGEYRGAFEKLKADTNALAKKLAEMVARLQNSSRGLKTATGEILSGANDLSERTTRQAATIEETSASIELISATVKKNADRAADARDKSRKVSQSAESGSEVMSRLNAAMDRITASSDKISDIIGLIDNIAFQTNLLALNASVEAARAGEAGKGFAVVAVEVRRLAQSAAKASKDIKGLIEQSAADVRQGSGLASDASGRLMDMVEEIKANAAHMDEIARESSSQATSIGEIGAAIAQLDEMTQHNAALVEQTNAAIEQTESQASDLDRIIAAFSIGASVDKVGGGDRRNPVPTAA